MLATPVKKIVRNCKLISIILLSACGENAIFGVSILFLFQTRLKQQKMFQFCKVCRYDLNNAPLYSV